jgi:hypothetical protein
MTLVHPSMVMDWKMVIKASAVLSNMMYLREVG